MKIFICGFSGSGKTSWLKSLEKGNKVNPKMRFYDLDELLCQKVGIATNQLGTWITANGEKLFRELEDDVLNEMLHDGNSFIMALGGGTLSIKNLEKIKANKENKIVYLKEEFEICFERIQNDSNRLLSQFSREKLITLYQEREKIYQQADLIILAKDINLIDGLSMLVHNFK